MDALEHFHVFHGFPLKGVGGLRKNFAHCLHIPYRPHGPQRAQPPPPPPPPPQPDASGSGWNVHGCIGTLPCVSWFSIERCWRVAQKLCTLFAHSVPATWTPDGSEVVGMCMDALEHFHVFHGFPLKGVGGLRKNFAHCLHIPYRPHGHQMAPKW